MKKIPHSGGSSASSKASMYSNATHQQEGVKLYDGTVTDGRQHPPTSIYAQQQFLPYTNNHPSSDYFPQQLNMRYHQQQQQNVVQNVPRRMDSHESFNPYQQQDPHHPPAIDIHHHQRYASPSPNKQYHYHQQQSPLTNSPTTSSPSVIPTPTL